jgi:stearoyl-CoA desaturase (delta-9 desaturase)
MPRYKKEDHKNCINDKNNTNNNNSNDKNNIILSEVNSTPTEYRMQIVWLSVLKLTLLHIIASYGAYLCVTRAKYQTLIWAYILAMSSAFGVLSGAHRLWSHKCYKAHYSLRVLLMILDTLALQNDIYEWCRDHRVHHKYSETDADPHNSKRGFFFSHMGWLMVKKHPMVIEKGSQIDLSDVLNDPVVRFQRKYYKELVIVIWGLIPTIIPYYFWSESLIVAFAINMARYAMTLHQVWN